MARLRDIENVPGEAFDSGNKTRIYAEDLQTLDDAIAALEEVVAGLGGGGANTALSNLSAVALNADLLPATNNARALGSNTLGMKEVWLGGTKGTKLVGSATGSDKTLTTPNKTGTIATTDDIPSLSGYLARGNSSTQNLFGSGMLFLLTTDSPADPYLKRATDLSDAESALSSIFGISIYLFRFDNGL